MAEAKSANGLAAAEQLYNEAVNETPPNRTKLDELVDVLCANPWLLYDGFFKKALEAASIVVDVCHGADDMQEDDNLSILTPPAAWGWTVLEETVCHAPPEELIESAYPKMALEFLQLADRTFEHMETTPAPIVRCAVQALTRFWPEIIRACISRGSGSPVWKQLYGHMLKLADTITLLSERSDDPALLTRLVKFLETEATTFTAAPPGSERKHDVLSLGMLPSAHAYIFKSVLARRGELARQQLVRLLPSGDHVVLCNTTFITAIINSIVYLMNLRPQFCEAILGRLTDWYAAINSAEQGLSPLQLVIVGKTLRLSLLQLYTRRYMGAYSELLETTLDQIGGPEWAAWQEQQTRERERRARQQARERDQMARQQQQQQQQEKVKESAQAAEHHSARWVPAPDEGEADMADQPAPGAGGGAATGPPLPSSLDAHPGGAAAAPNRMAPSMQRQRPGAGFAQKRAARQAADGGDEDEEKQSRMLEENAKRVKFDESMDVVEPGLDSAVDGPTEEQQRALDADQEMEAEMEAAVQSMPQFTLPSMDEMTEAARHLQVVEAIKRVIAGTEQLQKFIAHKRVVDSTAIGSSTPRALPNGLTTNSGVLEDSMVMLVRLVTNCYIMFGEFCKVRGSAPDMDASSRWKTMHGCVEDILQMIVAAPRERYSLAMILLYELWMSVVITDPELARAPGTPANEYTVFALYLSWCRRIFDAIVGSSMQAATAAAAAAAPPAPVPAPAAGTENGAAAAPAQPPLPAENLILEFFKEAPYIEPALMAKLEVCLKTPATAALGFATLERAIELRPTIFSAGLDMLLTYSVHPDRTTRVGCIRAVRKHYATIKTALKIEKVAAASFNYGVLQADTHSKNAEAEVEAIFRRVEEPVDGGPAPSDEEQLANKSAQALALRQRARQAIDGSLVSHSELLLALSTKNMSLLSHVFDTYRTAPLPVQVAIRQLITPLVKSVAAAPSRIVPVLTQFPKGAETLALRVLFLLCADGQRVPPRELVEPVLRMCDERGLDGNFIVFIMNGMERAEALARLPLLVSILNGTDRPKALVREGFMRLTTPFLGRPSVLSPTELLMGLHNGVTRDNIAKHVEAVGVYESMVRPDGKPMFSTMLFEAALKLLVDQDPVSPLVMQTADIFHRRRGGPAGTVIGLLRRHIEREVWNMDDHVFDAFVGSFHVMLPGTLALVKLLPAEPLKAVVDRSPALRTAIREYVGKMPEPARKQYKWLIDSAPAPAQPNA